MYAAIPGSKVSTDAGGWIFPSNASLPTIQVDIGGQKFTINPKDHVFADAGNGMSFGGMQSRGNLTFNIYGDTFLKSIYAIFDVGNLRFGCVQRSQPSGSSGSSTPSSTSSSSSS